MIRGLFDRGVQLDLNSGEIRARSATALRAALAVHVAISPSRLVELGAMSDRALEARANALDTLAARLSSGLDPDAPAPGALLGWIQDQDIPLDRGWADAIATARQWQRHRAPFQRALLDALSEHVSGERDCVRTLMSNRRRLAGGDEEPELPRQKMILDLSALGALAPAPLARIPRGDPVDIAMSPGQALEIMLATHRFLLVCGVPWLLVDDVGEDLRLGLGRSVVGRSTDCEAVVDDSYRAISRRHVVLDIRDSERVVLTDISSLGTSLPEEYARNRMH